MLSRKPRLEYPGGVYHLIQRGNNKEFIFEKKEDKQYLLELIEKYKKLMEFEVYGYTIMGNHYHLVIRLGNVPLKDIMHRINNQFSREYNRKNKRTGHVFENRYKGILVVDDKYLLSLLRYVHQNPVSASMCRNIKDYFWSSDKYYRQNNKYGIVNIDFILDVFSNCRTDAIKTYIDFMDENKKEDIAVFEDTDIIGKVTTATLDSIMEKKRTLDDILWQIANDQKIYDEIKSGSRKRYLSSYKKEFIEFAMKFRYTMKEIGDSISISDVAVFKIHSKD